jgi:hypothetical protein
MDIVERVKWYVKFPKTKALIINKYFQEFLKITTENSGQNRTYNHLSLEMVHKIYWGLEISRVPR